MTQEQKKEPTYTLIDVEGLAADLAGEAFNREVREIPSGDVHEMHIDNIGNVVAMPRSRWANYMFNMKEMYTKLILTFRKEIQEED